MDENNKEAIEIIKGAISLERDGEKFYLNASENTSDPGGKRIFRTLANDEHEHMKFLNEILETLQGTGEWKEGSKGYYNDEEIQAHLRIFPTDIEKIKKEIQADEDSVEALRLAIEKEEESIKYYSNAAEKTTDSRGKKFYLYLANFEKLHRQLLEDYKDFMEDPSPGWDSLERWSCQT